jgi:allantoin racemase
MKIRVILPAVTKNLAYFENLYLNIMEGQHEISAASLKKGPVSIECEYDEALAIPEVIAKAREAEREGCDAVVVDCFGDPGVKAAREILKIPVVGPGEASIHIAAILGHRFSIVTVLDNVFPLIDNNCRVYGLESKLASIRFINVPVLNLHKGEAGIAELLVEESIKAIEEDGAHVIVLGCTGMSGLAKAVRTGLVGRGYSIPVIDPIVAALKMVQILVEMKLTHSKRTYPYPPEKEIFGYEI